MKTLLIFDSFLVVEKMDISLFEHSEIVYLFSLTSQFAMLTVLVEKLREAGCVVESIQTARMINVVAEDLRSKYIQFIGELPKQLQQRQKDLKEFFAIDKHASLWWLSLIAEKNTFKSDSFNRLVQLDSIIEVIRRNKISKVLFASSSRKLEEALLKYSCKNLIEFRVLSTRHTGGIKEHILAGQKMHYLKHIMYLFNSVIHSFLLTRRIKKKVGGLKRPSVYGDALMFFTYYPNIDTTLALKGVFSNKYYLELQKTLEAEERNIIWIAMYVYNNFMSLDEALDYTRRFIKNGYIIFFSEEFNSIGIQAKALLTMLASGFKFLRVEKRISKVHTFGDYNFYPIFKDDWYSSFVGRTGYFGLLYYYIFKSLLRRLKAGKCLYTSEMHAWEKALISSRDAIGSAMLLFGYQSTTVSRMFLNHFNHPSEISDGGSYCLPQPNKIVCNGRLPYSYMQESGWPQEKLAIVEALRYSYLKKSLNLQVPIEKQDVVLLAFSISPEEGSSIFNIVYEAFKDRKDVEVWLRPHPALRLEDVFKLSGMSAKDAPFKTKNGRLEDILLKVKAVIVGQSGVSIEAIACGCNVVIVEVPEWINMSPLKNLHSQIVRRVDSAQSLQEVISGIFQEEYDAEKHATEARKIINDFFYLNQETDTPKNFLKLLLSANE